MKNYVVEDIWDRRLEGKAWQVKEEFVAFLSFILEQEINSVLEIGTFKGGSALGFLSLVCTVDSVDIIKQPEVRTLEARYRKLFNFYLREDFLKVLETKDAEYDLLWIDGDHSYEGCMEDFTRFAPYVKQGGYIAFHDVVKSPLHEQQGCEVWKVIEEVQGPMKRIDFITDGNWGGITVLKCL